MRPIGFSTGAIAKHDFHSALSRLRELGISVVELSALRFEELDPLVASMPELDLRDFEFVSFHAPSRFAVSDEHARQVDPTMTEAQLILERFGERLREVHVADVNTSSRHDPLSVYAMSAFRSVSLLIPDSVPVVLETLIDQGQSDILTEIDRAGRALNPAWLRATG